MVCEVLSSLAWSTVIAVGTFHPVSLSLCLHSGEVLGGSNLRPDQSSGVSLCLLHRAAAAQTLWRARAATMPARAMMLSSLTF